MLEFFRKYQRYVFLLITVVIVISFSFFGTYNTLGSDTWREQVAFKAVDGREITRFDVDDMATFLATDSDDKLLYGGVWGPNFLNDGVIRKDFLKTGLAQELVLSYQADLEEDLQRRLVKEKRYRSYVHPQARFLSAENAWNYFAPELTTSLAALRASQNGNDPEAFTHRVKLFLAEKQLPASMLKQILRYQEKQYNWLTPDASLERMDLSLFGYHNLEDWFGPHFTRLVSQFIINAAILAEDKGYQVSKAEVMAELIRNTEVSYQQNKNNPHLGVASPEEYLNEQLRRLNMDQGRAVKIWRQVMLFRRYFNDVGNSALTDTMAYQNFLDFSKQSVSLEVYHLPQALRFADFDTLQKFEVYLNAVAKRSKDPLALPKDFLAVAEVEKTFPELVQKRYVLEVAQVNKKSLQAKIGLKETWNWEVSDQNWTTLKKQFPDLGVKKGDTKEARFAALDNLDQITRSQVDIFARSAIIDAHPEWLNKALDDAEPQIVTIGLRGQGGNAPFEGLISKEKRQELMQVLDKAQMGAETSIDPSLQAFTADQQTYYRIKVLERASQPEILTFAEVNTDGTLDKMRHQLLEKYYVAIRERDPATYQKEDKSWKSLESVQNLVAEQYLDKVLKALQPIQKSLSKQDKETLSKDQAASLRFYDYVKQVKASIEKDPNFAKQFVRDKKDGLDQDHLLATAPLAEQWLLEKSYVNIDRSKPHEDIEPSEVFALQERTWSAIKTPANGNLLFFQFREKGIPENQGEAIAKQTEKAHQLLSAEAQRVLMHYVLQELLAKNAISLNYLKTGSEGSPLSKPEMTDDES